MSKTLVPSKVSKQTRDDQIMASTIFSLQPPYRTGSSAPILGLLLICNGGSGNLFIWKKKMNWSMTREYYLIFLVMLFKRIIMTLGRKIVQLNSSSYMSSSKDSGSRFRKVSVLKTLGCQGKVRKLGLINLSSMKVRKKVSESSRSATRSQR